MKFQPLSMDGAFVIHLDPISDSRGFFSRLFCREEMEEHGLDPHIEQVNTSLSRDKGTLRGMHYQLGAHAETKLVRCVAGAVYDVILDLRPDSPTFGKWEGVELTEENRTMIYVPRGFGHGIQTLAPDSELIYLVSARYAPHAERGVRWNDPRFAIEWPLEPTVVSSKDAAHPDFDPAYHLTPDFT